MWGLFYRGGREGGRERERCWQFYVLEKEVAVLSWCILCGGYVTEEGEKEEEREGLCDRRVNISWNLMHIVCGLFVQEARGESPPVPAARTRAADEPLPVSHVPSFLWYPSKSFKHLVCRQREFTVWGLLSVWILTTVGIFFFWFVFVQVCSEGRFL